MTVAELRKIVNELSDFEGDPWQENFLRIIEEHPQGSFYRAVTRKAQSSFTVVTKTPVSGCCPAAGWGHCQRRRNAI